MCNWKVRRLKFAYLGKTREMFAKLFLWPSVADRVTGDGEKSLKTLFDKQGDRFCVSQILLNLYWRPVNL